MLAARADLAQSQPATSPLHGSYPPLGYTLALDHSRWKDLRQVVNIHLQVSSIFRMDSPRTLWGKKGGDDEDDLLQFSDKDGPPLVMTTVTSIFL